MARATPWRVPLTLTMTLTLTMLRVTLTLAMLRVTLTLAMLRVTLPLLLTLLLSVTRALARRGPSVGTARCAPRPPSDGRAPRVRDRARARARARLRVAPRVRDRTRARARARVRVKVTDPISLPLTRSISHPSSGRAPRRQRCSAHTTPRPPPHPATRACAGCGATTAAGGGRCGRDMRGIWARYGRDIGEMDGSWRWEMGPPHLFPPNISLHLPYISTVSPLNLACISPVQVGDGAASPLPTRSSLGGPLGGR